MSEKSSTKQVKLFVMAPPTCFSYWRCSETDCIVLSSSKAIANATEIFFLCIHSFGVELELLNNGNVYTLYTRLLTDHVQMLDSSSKHYIFDC